MGFLFNRKAKHIPRNAVWHITQEGREALQNFNGNPESQVLMILESSGSRSIDEIAQESGLSRGQVERSALALARKERIQLANARGTDDTD